MEKSIKKQAKETWDELCELEAKMYQVEKAREEKLNSIHNRFSSLRVELADIFNREDEPEVIEFIETLTHIFGEGRTIEVLPGTINGSSRINAHTADATA